MSYRGFGSYRGDLVDDAGGSEDIGLDLSSYPDVSDDFSDVSGGSSTVDQPDFLSGGLTGSSIMKFLGGSSPKNALSQISSFFGSGAAAGAASLAVPAAKSIARLMGKRIRGTRGGVSIGGTGRRMNPGNFKALGRAMRRLTAFERRARHVVQFTHPPAHARVKFKFHRRRKKR